MTKKETTNNFNKKEDISLENEDNLDNTTSIKEKILEKEEPLLDISFKDTSEISVPPRLIDQVIGQDEAVEIIKKAALQKRHIMLIGEPGTGKSMLGQAMAELLPKEDLVDILCLPNPKYPNQPRIATLPAGHGSRKVQMDRELARKKGNKRFVISLIILIAIIGYAIIATASRPDLQPQTLLMAMFVGFFIFFMLNQSRGRQDVLVPKLLVDNKNSKRAPFNDATGSHAGALLGDVRHDPFQSFYDSALTVVDSNGESHTESLSKVVDNLILEKLDQVERKEESNYEAVFVKNGELKVLADMNGQLSFVDVLSVNRYDYDGDLVKIVLENNKEIVVTPEHKIAVRRNGDVKYIRAIDLDMESDELLLRDNIIIDEADIISTYELKQQKQAKLYKEFLRLRKENPEWGYKKLSKVLFNNYSKCRWWYNNSHKPISIQTIEKLREQELIPLTLDNPKLPVISRILGSLYGDGGIFSNFNGIFLSSKELENVKAFARDLETIFGEEISANARIVEGGEKGHSWSYQNTNRAVIRFFSALGAPIGNKTKTDLIVPSWIYLDNQLQDEFFGAFLGSEIGIPKVHVNNRSLNTLDIAITANEKTLANRMQFIGEVKAYLNRKGIKTQEVSQHKLNHPNKYLVRLLISTKYENVLQFVKSIKLNYCTYKTTKLKKTLDEFTYIKYERYNELISEGYSAERAMNLLQLTPRDLYHIINYVEEESV